MRRGGQLVDLLQDGNIGLLHAVDRFDHRRGCRFATYAGWWIRQAILRSLIDNGSVIRLPAQVHNQVYELRKTRQRLVHRLGREPTPTGARRGDVRLGGGGARAPRRRVGAAVAR
jgi:RNA polymerase primary sigma factor